MCEQNREKKLLQVSHLKKYFPHARDLLNRTTSYLKAVDDVSFDINKGETLSLVGESGCGKSTLGRCIIRGIEATSGKMMYQKKNSEWIDFFSLKSRHLRALRKDMQMVFQDPNSSLDPRMTIYDIIAEPLIVNKYGDRKKIEARVKYLADVVGLSIKYLKRYPHAFSGGQRQRIGIARALALQPRLVIADEAVSALDVSVQAQVINLMEELQEKFNLTYLFISHDLSVVEHISDRVAVMYVGKIVEIADIRQLFSSPAHPYTEALLSAVPKPDPRNKMERIILSGEVPNPINPPYGCYFHPRCSYKKKRCRLEKPELREIRPGQFCACHFSEKLPLKGT